MKEFRNPQNVHQPLGSYSHQIEITRNERLLVLSGQVGVREDGTVPDQAIEQMDVALENIFRNLRAANMDVKDIIKLTYYLVGEIDTAKDAKSCCPNYRDISHAAPCYMSQHWRARCLRLRLMRGHPMRTRANRYSKILISRVHRSFTASTRSMYLWVLFFNNPF